MSTEIPQGFWHFEKELDMNVSHGGPQNSLGIRSRLCSSPGSIALGTQQLMCCWSFVPDILVDILGLFRVLHGINVQKDIEPPLIVGQDDNQRVFGNLLVYRGNGSPIALLIRFGIAQTTMAEGYEA